MKLAIGPFTDLAGYVSREFWSTFSSLEQNHGWELLDVPHLGAARMGELPALLRTRFGALPEAVLFWESYAAAGGHVPSLLDAGARVYMMTDDLHATERQGMREALQRAHGILSTYAPVFGDFFPEVDAGKVTWVPHAAGPDFLLPINDAPEPVVFVSGAVNDHYPLRQVMRGIAQRRPELARTHAHPGYYFRYKYEIDGRIGRGYAEKIGACLAAFTDGLRYRYIVAKHFEIPAAGALMIADRSCAPQLETLGFVDSEHYLAASADDLERVIDYALAAEHREEIDAIRRRGHALAHARHTTVHRAAQIDAVCALRHG